MSARCRPCEYWLGQTQLLDNPSRRHVECFADSSLNYRRINRFRTERIYTHAYRLGYANRISKLNLAFTRPARLDYVIADISRHICAGTIDLSGVFSARCSSPMPCVCAGSLTDHPS